MPVTSLFDADVTDEDQQTITSLQPTLTCNEVKLLMDEQHGLESQSTNIANLQPRTSNYR